MEEWSDDKVPASVLTTTNNEGCSVDGTGVLRYLWTGELARGPYLPKDLSGAWLCTKLAMKVSRVKTRNASEAETCRVRLARAGAFETPRLNQEHTVALESRIGPVWETRAMAGSGPAPDSCDAMQCRVLGRN